MPDRPGTAAGRALAALVALLAFARLAVAEPAAPEAGFPVGLARGATTAVVAVIDGDTVVLDDGREVRLVGLQAPKLPLGRPGFPAWPLAAEAKAALAALTLGRRVILGYGGRLRDRHGRALAHLFDAELGTWIQGALLEGGMARVYSFADNRALVAEMLALERGARTGPRGIWADPFYAPRNAASAGDHLGGFELVEGRVLEAATARGTVYLNFGADWRRDFTVAIRRADLETFAAAGVDPLRYAGRLIRVRGWLKSYNGPMIEATHPEQIEVLE